MKTPLISLLMVLAMLATACTGDVATPRRKAYPRIDVPAARYEAADDAPVVFETNTATLSQRDTTRSASDGSVWLNVAYPTFGNGAVVYSTFTRTSSARQLEEVIDNRLERIGLNVGGNRSELIELTSDGGFSGRIIVTPAGTVTPVQFLANDDRWVITGAFYLPDINTASADSVAPIIAAVKRDIIHALQHLKR